MSHFLRSLRLGEFALRYYYTPVGRLRDCLREGGPLQQRRTARGRHAMELAAAALPLLPPGDASRAAVELHFLTGRKYWYQTLFCLWTFARQSGRLLAPVIHDDGTLAAEHQAGISRHFPLARFESMAAAVARLETLLPASRYPVLRERWINYPHIRKLTDVHLGGSGWKLVLDSDLLFFRRPDFLLHWLDQPDRPLHAVDCQTSYGYSRPLLDELAGRPVADLVNVGLIGLDSSAIEWERLEFWCRTLIERERTSYFLEQALCALLTAGRPCAIAPAADYVTLPTPPEATACRAVMHHYVNHSQRWYFQHNWRRVLANGAPHP